MTDKSQHPVFDLPKQTNYEDSFRMAVETLNTQDGPTQAERSGATFIHEGHGAYELRYFNRPVRVALPEATPVYIDSGEAIGLWEAIVILHYLTQTGPVQPAERVIAFQEIPDGKFYEGPFKNRTKWGLLRAFGENPKRLLDIKDTLGAEVMNQGDAGLKVLALPKVPIYLVVWGGDEEFPAEANVLFQNDVMSYLSIEDAVVTASLAVIHAGKAASASA